MPEVGFRVWVHVGTSDSLVVEDPGLQFPEIHYALVRGGLGVGATTWRRTTVTSPFVHGSFDVNQVMDRRQLNWTVRVRSTTVDELDYDIEQLIQAFTQYAFFVAFEMDDNAGHVYSCTAADWSLGDGGQYNDLMLRSYTQEVKLVIPAQPQPLIGRF